MSTTADLFLKIDEQRRLVEKLALWESVKAQGIDINTVETFGFDEKLLTKAQKFEIKRASVRGQRDPVSGVHEHNTVHPFCGNRLAHGPYVSRVFNYVRHHDGSTTTLNPMLKAV